mmetsp:Transcript_39416/g.77550  ORF Transcript_39416/g.77550 Transcript_39416/m.77550 type:complete len:112 (+) Transcript_39416:1763-2098(+)
MCDEVHSVIVRRHTQKDLSALEPFSCSLFLSPSLPPKNTSPLTLFPFSATSHSCIPLFVSFQFSRFRVGPFDYTSDLAKEARNEKQMDASEEGRKYGGGTRDINGKKEKDN